MTGNDLVKFFLRTPLHVFLGNIMLITVIGRRTGKKYSTPVGFYREDGYLWVITSRDRTWWRNINKSPNVTLLLKGKTVDAVAEVELDEKAVETHVLDYVRHIPMAARSLGVRIENKTPNAEDIVRVARDRLFVRINLN